MNWYFVNGKTGERKVLKRSEAVDRLNAAAVKLAEEIKQNDPLANVSFFAGGNQFIVCDF